MLPLLSCIITLILNGPWSTKQQAWTSVHVKVSCCLAVQKPLSARPSAVLPWQGTLRQEKTSIEVNANGMGERMI